MGSQPKVLVLAGPNGAGKSTAASALIPHGTPYLNADEIAKALPGYPSTQVDLLAGRLLLTQMEGLEERRSTFAVETTLAGRSLAQRVSRLRDTGYLSELMFLWTPNPEFSILRVAQRVRLGGHSIPEETIRRRYWAGLSNLFRSYIPISDVWKVYDNTRLAGFRLIASGSTNSVSDVPDPDQWNALCKGVSDESRLFRPGPPKLFGEGT